MVEDILFQTPTNPKLEILKTHFPACLDKAGRLMVARLSEAPRGGGGRIL